MKYLSYLLLLLLLPVNAMSVEIYGHRGARALSPENSLPGHKTAIEIGVDYIDMDVMMTKDKVVVVTHDYYLNPDITRDSRGQWLPNDSKLWINEMTFEQLQQYDVGKINPNSKYARIFPHQKPVNGTRILSLREVIAWTKQHAGYQVGFQIELKTDPRQWQHISDPEQLARAVAQILSEEEVIDRSEVQSLDWRNLLAIKQENDQIKTAFLTSMTTMTDMSSSDPETARLWTGGYLLKDYNSITEMIVALGGDIWGPEDLQLVDRKQVKKAQKMGLKVVVWYLALEHDDVHRRLERLLDLGVDGIITDEPHTLKAMVNRREIAGGKH